MNACLTCKGPLNTTDPLTLDCGGDCLLCMAEAGDPDAAVSVALHARRMRNALVGIASCATQCGCCQMHQQVAAGALTA
jgi:hypothetical protein